MEPIQILYLIAVVIVLIIIYVIFTKKDDHSSDSDSSSGSNFTDNGWIVFIRPGCSWCHKQTDELKSTPFNYVECVPPGGTITHYASGTAIPAPSEKQCSSVHGFPTWYNIHSHRTVDGFKTIDQLNALK